MSVDLQGFLDELGRRLVRARARAGLSVTALAKNAGVSRRYLTEAEAGRANPSVLLLARLGHALRVDLTELLGDMPVAPRLRERIALVGLRGAGKSTVGRLLALELEVPLVELDRRVEAQAGIELAEIFGVHGIDAFHRFEALALEEVLGEGERMVIAVGGSIVDERENFRRLCDTCRTVWLRAEPEEHFRRVLAQGDRRPMSNRPRAMEELRALLGRREPAYAQCELTVATDTHGAQEVAREVLTRLAGVTG